MLDDPLSEILAFVGARCEVAGGFTAGGRWGIRFPRPDAIKFGVVVNGACWMRVDGLDTSQQLQAGDVFFVKGDRAFDVLSDLDAAPLDARKVFREAPNNMASLGDGADVLYLGGHVELDETRRNLLLDELPPIIHVASDSEQAAGLQWLAREVVSEVQTKKVGAGLSTASLAQLLFVRVLRAHLEAGGQANVGWLRGLGDPRIALVIALMHSEPSRNWHLDELAKTTGMSRSVLAARFKAVCGVPPLTYLTEWRMRLAVRALEEGTKPVSQIATMLGYTSVSAFSNAFKRVTGIAPKRFQFSSGNVDG
ncbi:AraC family transcriptional regulator [Roseospira marina]|uniref:AraC family transcriptional regulator n=1 Tax=Roseospira marina TaxID=140057 RepID=A0A5M6IDL7_9PROT|nr:AraC family transcriptional regulator [Roseospira marina]KAA5606384.1 AraC family transcriptional regulator [Roseospira marina]MBB4314212.1 AraC-like DNA-binding protein [Roseospira marina]MBB5087373.1 AraC-like DNA-binding protein [Roseospira marina]